MNVEPEVLGVVGTVVAALVGAVAKLYTDLGTARARMVTMEEERREEARAAKDDAVSETKALMDALSKVSALSDAIIGRRSLP